MKRFVLPVLALTLSLTLAACGGQAAATAAVPAANSKLPASYANALPPLTQLIVGTFRLEGQEQAITAEQAKELAILWRGYRTVSKSESSSQKELVGLQKQIEAAMTTAQLDAIAAMQLTNEDLIAVMTEQGVTMSAEGESELSEEEQANLEMLRSAADSQNSGGGGGGGGGMPGGGMPAGGGMPPGGMGGEIGDRPPDQVTGEQGASRAAGPAVPTALLAKLIALLESK